MAGSIREHNGGIVFEITPTDFQFTTFSNPQIPEPKKAKDLRIVIDQDNVHGLMNDRIMFRSAYRGRPMWTKNLTGFNETMDKINSNYIKHILPKAYEEVGPEIPLDLMFNGYLNKEEDRNFVNHGENAFSIVDNKIQFIGTYSYELLSYVNDKRFGIVWKLLRSGYFNLKVEDFTIQSTEKPYIVHLNLKSADF